MTVDRPTSPGLWTREGKFYRVWISEGEMRFDIIFGDGTLSNGSSNIASLPAGNWHNLTAPATTAEAREKFRGWLKGHCNQSSDEQISDKAAEIFAGGDREAGQEPGVIDQLYRHALKCVDRVFQECTENPKPILPDFLGIGEDKFDGVVKLAEAYRKLSDKITTVTTKLEKYKRVLIENQDFCGAAAVKDCLQLLNGFEPKLLSEVENEITTLKATVAKLEEQVATEHAKYINSERAATVALQAQTILKQAEEIAEQKATVEKLEGEVKSLHLHQWDHAVITLAKEQGWSAEDGPVAAWLREKITQQPEVIEGKGQADPRLIAAVRDVLQELRQVTDVAFSQKDGTVRLRQSQFARLREYAEATLPPRKPAFVAPPKPEQHLIRYDGGMTCWAIRDGYWYRRIGITGGMSAGLCELLDEKTGEPIKEQA